MFFFTLSIFSYYIYGIYNLLKNKYYYQDYNNIEDKNKNKDKNKVEGIYNFLLNNNIYNVKPENLIINNIDNNMFLEQYISKYYNNYTSFNKYTIENIKYILLHTKNENLKNCYNIILIDFSNFAKNLISKNYNY